MNEKHKSCFKCGEIKPLSAFYAHPMMADGHLNKCKECNKKDVSLNRYARADYYNTYDSNRYRTCPRRKARDASMSAIKTGHLVRPAICSSCGKTDCEIQGHHWSYLEEHWLDVIWLCTECHGKEHRKINAEARKAKALENERTENSVLLSIYELQ